MQDYTINVGYRTTAKVRIRANTMDEAKEAVKKFVMKHGVDKMDELAYQELERVDIPYSGIISREVTTLE